MKKHFIIATAVAFLSTGAIAASIDKAEMQAQHGLTDKAKSELIDVVFSTSADDDKARALYLLGTLSYSSNDIEAALDTWRHLIEQYPNSDQAALVKTRINSLADILGDSDQEKLSNAVASSYVRNGDFWSRDRDKAFVIDSSWIPKIEASVHWYDKTISEFPGTTAAKVAYQNKLKTLLGWQERGKYGDAYGVKKSHSEYMPQVLDTFDKFSNAHPDAASIPAIRYQIAQAYWNIKDWANTRKWLNAIIDDAGDKETFYSQTAKLRLQKVEY